MDLLFPLYGSWYRMKQVREPEGVAGSAEDKCGGCWTNGGSLCCRCRVPCLLFRWDLQTENMRLDLLRATASTRASGAFARSTTAQARTTLDSSVNCFRPRARVRKLTQKGKKAMLATNWSGKELRQAEFVRVLVSLRRKLDSVAGSTPSYIRIESWIFYAFNPTAAHRF